MYKDLNVDKCKQLENEFGNAAKHLNKQTEIIVSELADSYINASNSYAEAITYVIATNKWKGMNEYLSNRLIERINSIAMNQPPSK
ncbi:hypothetical protein ACQV2X_05515 [Facklamia sp. P12945]|uniref:hypothetical protein n=1 Tax=unclassified Facklamia TaxID=2622293 RepID=UPI003D17EDD8